MSTKVPTGPETLDQTIETPAADFSSEVAENMNESTSTHESTSTSEPKGLRAWAATHVPLIVRTLSLVFVITTWQVIADTGIIDATFFSTPSEVVKLLWEWFSTGFIWEHIRVSGIEVGLGYFFAVVIGVPIGVLIARVRVARYALEPYIMAFYASPTVAFLPLLIIWFGIGVTPKVILVAIASVFVIIINTETGVSNVDPRLVEAARSFTAGRFTILWKVIGPASLPFILSGFRLAIGRALIMMVVAELYSADAGIGFLIFRGGAVYNTTQVFAGIAILIAVALVANSFLRYLERRVAPWLA